jgi:hypothetical protein
MKSTVRIPMTWNVLICTGHLVLLGH